MNSDRRGFLRQALSGNATTSARPVRLAHDPFDDEMERLRRVDPRLVGYDEVDRIALALERPRAVAAGAAGRVWVAGDEHLVLLVEGREKARFALPQPPSCVGESFEQDRVYVGLGDRIEVRDTTGVLLDRWPSEGEGAFLTSIAADGDAVFVADAGRCRVERRDRRGRLVTAFGEGRIASGPHFVVPSPFLDLALTREHTLWVTNPGRHRIERYSLAGVPLATCGTSGAAIDGFCGCCNPTHLAVLADGRVVTTEKGLPRVKVLHPSGRLAAVVAAPDLFARNASGLDLAVDERDRIAVLDPAERALRIFAPRTETSRND